MKCKEKGGNRNNLSSETRLVQDDSESPPPSRYSNRPGSNLLCPVPLCDVALIHKANDLLLANGLLLSTRVSRRGKT